MIRYRRVITSLPCRYLIPTSHPPSLLIFFVSLNTILRSTSNFVIIELYATSSVLGSRMKHLTFTSGFGEIPRRSRIADGGSGSERQQRISEALDGGRSEGAGPEEDGRRHRRPNAEARQGHRMILHILDILDELLGMGDGNVSNRDDSVFNAPRRLGDVVDGLRQPRIRRRRQFVGNLVLGVVVGGKIGHGNA